MRQFLDGLGRGTGMALPGILFAGAVFYYKQGLSTADNIMVIGITSVLLFCIIGYSILHKTLYPRFGRLALFCFATWASTVAFVRVLSFASSLPGNQARAINTASALFFTITLLVAAWGQTWIKELIVYLFGPPAATAQEKTAIIEMHVMTERAETAEAEVKAKEGTP